MLKGKVAVVTGGTRGIGYAIVKKFLENGACVALLGSRKETVDQALQKIKEEQKNPKVMGMWPEISDPKEVKEAFQKVKEEWGSLDILVNNAGISARDSLYDYEPEAFQKIMNLNVNANFDVGYPLPEGCPYKLTMELVFKMTPPPCSFIIFAPAWDMR